MAVFLCSHFDLEVGFLCINMGLNVGYLYSDFDLKVDYSYFNLGLDIGHDVVSCFESKIKIEKSFFPECTQI